MSAASVSKTITTTLGYLISLVRKYTPLSAKSETLEDIYNYLPISDSISTSGQPSEAQFSLIKEAGFNHVINLAPANAENSLKDETATLSELGLSYTHFPVNFVKPSDRKFAMFVERMKELEDEKVWVHCAANMRVSAFMYRYRTQVLMTEKAEARQDLEKIWEPMGVWSKFISRDPIVEK